MSGSWEDRLSAASDIAADDPDSAESALRSVKSEIDARIKDLRERIALPRQQAKHEADERIRQYFTNHDHLPTIKHAAVELGLPYSRVAKIRQDVDRQRFRAEMREMERQRRIEWRQSVLDGVWTDGWDGHTFEEITIADVRMGDYLEVVDDKRADYRVRPVDQPSHLIALDDAETDHPVRVINVG